MITAAEARRFSDSTSLNERQKILRIIYKKIDKLILDASKAGERECCLYLSESHYKALLKEDFYEIFKNYKDIGYVIAFNNIADEPKILLNWDVQYSRGFKKLNKIRDFKKYVCGHDMHRGYSDLVIYPSIE